jgi:hypothetical protein
VENDVSQCVGATSDVPVFHALPPELVPRTRALCESAVAGLRDAGSTARSAGASVSDIAAWIGSLIADMRVAATCLEAADVGTAVAGDADLDGYCRIVRVSGEPAPIFIRGILQANLILFEEVSQGGTSLAGDKLDGLDRAFAAVLSFLSASASAPARRIGAWNAAPVEGYDPLRRWVRGHHIFVMLTQGLILSLQDMEGALIEGRADDVVGALELATVLMEGSAIAFQFAADFAPEQYRDTVRPTMMPPLAPEGLSGVLSADHRYLQQVLSRLKPRLKQVQLAEADRYRRFVTAFQQAYDDHIHVCSRFVGSKEPSLLMKSGDDKSAVQQLEHFKRLRMKVFKKSSG